MNCAQCQEKAKQCSIMKADYNFELKKLQQDLSIEKVALEIQFQKESKKIIDRYNKEKSQRQEDNKNWISKYDSVLREHQTKVNRLLLENQQNKQLLEKQVREEYARKYQEERAGYSVTLSQLKKNHEQEKIILMENHRREFGQLQSSSEERVIKLMEQHQQLINQISNDYEGKIANIRKDNAETASLYEKLKIDSQQNQNSLYKELYQRKQDIEEMRDRIEGLQTALKKTESDLKRKEEELEAVIRKNEVKVQALTRRFEEEKQSIIDQMSKQMETLLRSKLQDCQHFESKVKVIQEKRQTQVKMYQSSLQQVKQLVEVRMSREEDVEQINTLRNILNQKERDLKEVTEEAKAYRLELDNKQQTFNRIFTANPQINQRMVRRRQIRISKGVSLQKDTAKYNSVGTCNNIPSGTGDLKRQIKIMPPMSSKQF